MRIRFGIYDLLFLISLAAIVGGLISGHSPFVFAGLACSALVLAVNGITMYRRQKERRALAEDKQAEDEQPEGED